VDVARGQLYQALVESALGQVGSYYPGGLEKLVRFEEVAP
jgi:hypothetical protein